MSDDIVVGVLGLPVQKDKKVLLTRRHSPNRLDWHKKWQIAGGELEFGETTKECLHRELWEELRVKPKILHPNPIAVTSIWYADEEKTKMDDHILLLAYLVDIGDQTPDLSQDPEEETSEYAWYTLEEAKKLDRLPLTLEILEDAFKLIHQNDIL